MIAVDTNLVVRLVAGDDTKQTATARFLFASETIWIAKTVLLETAWVLRSFYGFDEPAIRQAFTNLLGLKNVHAEDHSSVATALALATHGVDIADALHVSSRPPEATFASFDRLLVRRAKRAGVRGIEVAQG